MKTKIKKLLLSLVLVVVAVVAVPQLFAVKAEAATCSGSCGTNVTWSFDMQTGELVISGTGAMKDYIYPSSAPWYEYRSYVKSVTIPDSVTSIADYAFYGCDGLTSVTIGNGVTSIGSSAFSGCTALNNVYYTGDISSWLNISFNSGASNPLYYGAKLYFDGELVTDIVIPDGTESVKNYAFYGCTSLTSVTIPDSITSIGSSAFYDCTSLTSITIPESVTSISSSAFSGCSKLMLELKKGSYAETYANEKNIPFYYNYDGSEDKTVSVTVTSELSFEINKETYTMTVNCSGDMLSFADEDAPWIPYKAYIKYIIINDGCTSISANAFENIYGLKSITIPDSVTSIGDYAFYGCSILESVIIGNGVTSIGNYAFSGCTALKNIYYTGDISSWLSISFNSFNSTPLYYGAKLYFDGELVTDIVIPDGTESIKTYAFYSYTSLASVTIPDSVTSIGFSAFSGCTSLASVIIPDSVTSIGFSAFSDCTSLTSVTISDNVTSIANFVFSDCTSLTSVTIPDNVTSIGYSSFENCTSLTGVTFPNSVTSIGEDAFYRCKSLTSITIPDSVTSIGKCAFYECTSLTSVTIGNSVTSIGDSAFYNCTGLTSLTFSDSVTSIGNDAFYGCKNIIDFYYTGDIASWCTIRKFKSVASNPLLYADNFYISGKLVEGELIIPYGVTYICGGAFYGYAGIESVIMPDTVTITGTTIFGNCKNLTSITLSENLTLISDQTFAGCTSLTSVTIPESVTSIGNAAFYYCTGLTSITIPDSITTIGDSAFCYCTGLTSITIPDSVTTIGSDAFYKCTGLSAVYFAGTEKEWKAIGYSSWSSPKPTIYFNHPQHEYKEIITQPTCTTAGSKTFSCVCGAVESTEVIPATGHSLKRITVKPTCTQDGKTCYQCQNCLTEFSVTVVPATGHTAGEWETVTVPTCETDGVSIKKCTVCETELETQAIPATGHTAGEWETKTAPTCETDGVSVKKCTVCQTELETQAIPATGHTAGEWETKTVPTCEKDGISAKKCTVCQTEIETQPIPATGHSYKEQTITSPTCIKEGEMKYTCHCGDSYTVTIPVLDHDKVRYYTAPTCLDPGMVYYICNSCGNMIGDMEIIPETGHIYGWAVVIAPTATESGSKKQVCTGCGEESGVVEAIPATGFEPTNGMVVDYVNNIVYGLDAGVDSLDSYTEFVVDGYEWTYTPGQYGFGTGTKAILKNGDEIIAEYTVVVFGDVDGNGWYDANDAFIVNMIVSGLLPQENLPDYMRTAADCNHDGIINELDFDLLINASVLLDDVDQSATQPELATQSAYIEYMSIISQSAGLEVEDTAPETNETVEGTDFGIFLAQIFLFIRKIFNFVFSFVIK